jgi:hypothetical protein
MDRKLVWTETASADIEAIARYIALHDPGAAARVGFACTIARRFFWNIPRLEQSSTNCAKAGGVN